LDLACVADLLSISVGEVIDIMNQIGIGSLDKCGFIQIMERGSSDICGYFRREIELKSPYTYNSTQLAYIYNLNHMEVNNAFQKLEIKEATSFMMPLVFAYIRA